MWSPLLLALASSCPPSQSPEFLEPFDGAPAEPTALGSARIDFAVHSRDADTFDALEPMWAQHGPGCEPPPALHSVSAFEQAVYQCKDHLMTAINATGYGVIYLTPTALVDFSGGESVVRIDVSTLRTSGRDWWDLYLTPVEDHLVLPLEEWLPDLQGQPRNAVHVRMDLGGSGRFYVSVWRDWQEQPLQANYLGYEEVLVPSPKQRETFELRISGDHLAFGLADHDLWWVDTDIDALPFDAAVLQLGHHSYNPTKDAAITPTVHDASQAGLPWGSPNTWHWDNLSISSARPFTRVGVDRRAVSSNEVSRTVQLDSPAPAGAHLRFAGLGLIQVSFDDGPFAPAQRQDGSKQAAGNHDAWHLSSYWTPIPEGARSVTFDLQDEGSWTFEKLVRDISVWSLDWAGIGCSGSAGVPQLSWGEPTVGNEAFYLQVESAASSSPAVFAVSKSELAPGPSGCGILVDLDPLALVVPGSGSAGVVTTSPAGGELLNLPIPPIGALVGLDLVAQAFVVDPAGTLVAGPLGFAASALGRISLR